MISKDLNKAKQVLDTGNLIALPTETVYGLAGNAFDDEAVKKIFSLKKRPHYNPLIVHIDSMDKLREVAADIPDLAWQLAKIFWPGSLTLVLKKQASIPDLVTGGKDTVAVRIPNHPMALELLSILEYPLAAPSANPFGSISPTSAEHVHRYFTDQLDVVLDGGSCSNGLESTIIGFEDGDAILYRHGAIAQEMIEEKIGSIKSVVFDDKSPNAPGMLTRHYSPSTPTVWTNDFQECIHNYEGQKIGLLLFQNKCESHHVSHQEILSPRGDDKEAAKNLYAAMHRLDHLELDVIIAERFPDQGLGKTINDRLQRATKK